MLPQSLSVFTPGHSELRGKHLFILSYSSLMGTPTQSLSLFTPGHSLLQSLSLFTPGHSEWWGNIPPVSLTLHPWHSWVGRNAPSVFTPGHSELRVNISLVSQSSCTCEHSEQRGIYSLNLSLYTSLLDTHPFQSLLLFTPGHSEQRGNIPSVFLTLHSWGL